MMMIIMIIIIIITPRNFTVISSPILLGIRKFRKKIMENQYTF